MEQEQEQDMEPDFRAIDLDANDVEQLRFLQDQITELRETAEALHQELTEKQSRHQQLLGAIAATDTMISNYLKVVNQKYACSDGNWELDLVQGKLIRKE